MNANNRKRILVFGCGWLGKKLGQFLISKGYTVYGTTRREANVAELEGLGIQPIILDLLTTELADTELPEVETVLVSISPGRKEGRDNYPEIISKIGSHYVDEPVQMIMYSSTSAYGNISGEVDELSEPADVMNMILVAERTLQQYAPDAVILRLCGLYGEDRHPVNSLAGRKDIPNGDARVNLVHSDDVIAVTYAVMEQRTVNEIFNVCGDDHPTRTHYYSSLARDKGMSEPAFLAGGEDRKLIDSGKVKANLGIRFDHSKLNRE